MIPAPTVNLTPTTRRTVLATTHTVLVATTTATALAVATPTHHPVVPTAPAVVIMTTATHTDPPITPTDLRKTATALRITPDPLVARTILSAPPATHTVRLATRMLPVVATTTIPPRLARPVVLPGERMRTPTVLLAANMALVDAMATTIVMISRTALRAATTARRTTPTGRHRATHMAPQVAPRVTPMDRRARHLGLSMTRTAPAVGTTTTTTRMAPPVVRRMTHMDRRQATHTGPRALLVPRMKATNPATVPEIIMVPRRGIPTVPLTATAPETTATGPATAPAITMAPRLARTTALAETRMARPTLRRMIRTAPRPPAPTVVRTTRTGPEMLMALRTMIRMALGVEVAMTKKQLFQGVEIYMLL